jgi:vacuolar-type H+-ATPase subunit I/STV1
MIVKMQKVSMVVQTKDKESTLDSLRELGLVHLENFQCSSPEVEAVLTEQNRAAMPPILFWPSLNPKKKLPPPPSTAAGDGDCFES